MYNLCIDKLSKTSSDYKQIIPKSVVINYDPLLAPKKVYTSFVNYIYKKRIGVKDPGEVYIVYKDTIDVTYAVPFKISEGGIPIYSSKFLDEDFKRYYYIEGPAEFEKINDDNFISSTMYILVEYTDQYGKTKIFREGVNQKFVKRSPKEIFDACNRFTNELDCNDINSYGIEKMKCRFIKDKCISIKEEIKKQDFLEDLTNITFKRTLSKKDKTGVFKQITDYNKTKLWNEALKKSNEYISQLILIKNLNVSQIKEVAKEQKAKLIGYYNFLLQLDIKKPKLETIVEDTNYNNLKQLYDFLIPKQEKKIEEQEQKQTEKEISDDLLKYNDIRLPVLQFKNRILSSKQIKVGNRYLLPDNIVAVLLEKENNNLLFDNGKTYESNKIIIREEKLSNFIEYEFFKILKEDHELIKNPPSEFYYNLYEKEYSYEKSNISVKTVRKISKDLPLDILYLVHLEMITSNDKLPKDIISRTAIYNTMGKVMYCLYQKDSNEFLESMDIFPATIEAKVYALKYKVDLFELSKKVEGDIELSDVINSYNKVLPIVKTIIQDIISQLEYGILNKDFKLLEKYIKIAEKQKVNNSKTIVLQINKLIKDAQKLILEKETIIEQMKEEKLTKKQEKEIEKEKRQQESQPEPVKIFYVVKKKKKKDSDD